MAYKTAFKIKFPSQICADNLLRNIKRSFSFSCDTLSPVIEVTPKDALLDNPPLISVKGLTSNQRVTLWNTFIDDAGLQFTSHSHYIADINGVVDVHNHVSVGGKYNGVFSEGLVSTLHSAPPTYLDKPQLKWARLYKRDVTQPMKYFLRVIDGHYSEQELYSTKPPSIIIETEFYRRVMANGVRRLEIEHGRLRGTLFLPPGDGPFPAVLDLFGAESGIKEYRSGLLASYGYASLVLAYYCYKDIPPLKDKIDLDYFLEAIEYLSSLPETDKGKIGLIGSSKGGEVGLTLCALTDKIKACVTINSYNRTIDIDYYLKGNLFVKKHVLSPQTSNIKIDENGRFIAYEKDDFYHWNRENTLPIDKLQNDCEVLLAAGDSDGGLAHKSAVVLKDRARKFKKESVYTVIYPNTGHLIDPPFLSHIDAVWNSTILVRNKKGERHKGLPHFYGGNPYYACQASKDLWKRTLALFHKRLVVESDTKVSSTKIYPPYT